MSVSDETRFCRLVNDYRFAHKEKRRTQQETERRLPSWCPSACEDEHVPLRPIGRGDVEKEEPKTKLRRERESGKRGRSRRVRAQRESDMFQLVDSDGNKRRS